MIYLTYNVLLALVAIVALPLLVVRGLLKGQSWKGIPERFGVLPHSFHQTTANSIWLHAVSVGEVLSCAQLVKALRRQFGEVPIFVSTSTPTGRRMASEKLSQWVNGIFYSPFDLPFALDRVFRTIRPRLVIVAETEIWPNLFRLTKRSGAGLVLVNARISDRSAPRYRRFRFFFSDVLQYPDLVLTQSDLDRERLIAAGAPPTRVRVGGNLKYDFEPSTEKVPQAVADSLDRLEAGPIVVAGSTREGEEEPVIEAFRKLSKSRRRALLVIAPRHPQRFDEAEKVLASSGISFARRSQLTPETLKRFQLPGVLLLDTLGELSSLYQVADIVFVGGSLNGWGGHNVLEPALSGKPVVVGPTMHNFRAITDELIAQRAIVRVDGPGELAAAFEDMLNHPTKAAEIGMRGRQVAESQRGATKRAVREAVEVYRHALPLRRPGWFAYLTLWLPASLWRSAARLRWAAYRRGRLHRRRLATFTLCVGNVTAGGVGKTPIVLWLVEQLSARGLAVGGLTRGYRRLSGDENVVRPGSAVSPRHTGDEAQILLCHLEEAGLDVPFGIGRDRYSVGRKLEGSQPVDILVLDDGFQHFKLKRDLDLVLIDALDPFGAGEMIPLGRLREPLSALSRADAFLLTRTEPGGYYDGLVARLRDLNPRAPVFAARSRAATAVNTVSGEGTPTERLRSERILAFCGLGNPESFWRSLELAGLTIVGHMRFRDHHVYSRSDVADIVSEARRREAGLVITTEKDLVNLWYAAEREGLKSGTLEGRAAGLFRPLPLYWLRLDTVVEHKDQLLDWIEKQMSFSPSSAAKVPLAVERRGAG